MKDFFDEFKYSWRGLNKNFRRFLIGVGIILLVILWNNIF